ncbi:MAG TPA: class I SAM-dependent methyltransferase, partial [Patescibacteria group bacterium]
KKLYNKKYISILDKNTKKFWDEKLNSIVYLDSQDGMTKDRINQAIKYMPEGKIKLLDIGAGYGFFEEELTKYRNNIAIYGIDISSEAIKLLNRRFIGNFKTSLANKIPFENTFFDVVVALEVFEHIPPSNVFEVYQEIYKKLKTYGELIISVPTNEHLEKMKDNPNGHVRQYNIDLIKAELEMNGFDIVSFSQFFAFSSFYTIKSLLTKILPHLWEPNDLVILAKKR